MTDKVRKTNRLFFFLAPLAMALAVGILFFSSKPVDWQGFDTSCGCGVPPPESTGEFNAQASQAIFNNQILKVAMKKLPDLAGYSTKPENVVLGAESDERWIEIDLSDQKLYAHRGDKIDYEFLISSGKWAPTPTGTFRIWVKLRYTLMHGGSKAKHTYYYLPNVPYTQYFYKGYGLHGAYWHHNFGHPMSHGCINLSIPDSQKLFYWTSPPLPLGKGVAYSSKEYPGTKVVIHE